jgi:hypothetical protein
MSCWCIQCGSTSCVGSTLSYALVILWWFVVVRAVVVRVTVMVVPWLCCGCDVAVLVLPYVVMVLWQSRGCAVVLLWLQRWCYRMLW